MASVMHPSPNHWVVHLASHSDPDSEVTVELRMKKVTADHLAHVEVSRIAALNPDATCPATENVGSAVLTILSSIAAIAVSSNVRACRTRRKSPISSRTR